MLPATRVRSLRCLTGTGREFAVCREVESIAHAHATDASEYLDMIRRACFNLKENPAASVPETFVLGNDGLLAQGTLLEQIDHETQARRERFQSMLEEKYESLNDKTYEAIVRCRRCGSSEVTWEEKQVRSADEAMTLYCVCTNCKNRWVTS